MAVWEAQERCHVANVFMNPGDRIQLTEEWEKDLKLGKFAEDGQDERGKPVKIGYKWLKQVSKERLAKNDPQAPDGFIYFPVAKNTPTKEYSDAGVKPTVWDQRH